jgi:D-threo-aldose 1-dehydrogenase
MITMFDPAEALPLGRTGLRVSRLGVGGTPFGNLFRPISDDDLGAAFEAAWDTGLRFFDTAPQYGGGLSEQRMGALLKTKPRNAYVLSSKVGKLLRPTPDGRAPEGIFAHGLPNEIVYDYTYDGTMRSIEASLVRTGHDRFDIVLIHDVNRRYHGDAVWDVYEIARTGACKALAELKDEGVIAGFGPANRELDVNIRFVREVDFNCMMLPTRFTLLDQSGADELLPLCEARGIGVLLAGAFDSGILATGAVPGATYTYAAAEPSVLARVARMEAICRAAGVPLAAAALQFPFRHPSIASVVTGMANRAEVEANTRLMATPIPDALWAELLAA